MLLTVDVGNTNITFGLFEKKELLYTFRLMTATQRTSDEFGANILGLLLYNGLKKEEIEGVIIASVVPNVMHSLVG
ncbi:MAG: type III pantothenate kinase, partial [Lachnospiraceae bacterium]|nr:type III pantothenate kinase [Lachnospiraceae bacterium]